MASYRVFQLKLNAQKEAARIAWLESQDSYTDAIRALIDEAMAGPAPDQCPSPSAIDLFDIRKVVEAAIESKLAGLAIASVTVDQDRDEDPELAAALDDLF